MPRLAGIVQRWEDGSMSGTVRWHDCMVSFDGLTSWQIEDGRVTQILARRPGSDADGATELELDGQ